MLETFDFSEALQLPEEKRKHVMKSLAHLSKYLNCYDKWQNIKELYQAKWPFQDSLSVFKNIICKNDFTQMID